MNFVIKFKYNLITNIILSFKYNLFHMIICLSKICNKVFRFLWHDKMKLIVFISYLYYYPICPYHILTIV